MKPGTRVDQFEITAPIGAGGMGEVFRARDTRLNREVAVKVLPRDFASDADRLRRFEQEAKTLAALNHPNVMTVFDAGQHEGSPYLVSELLEGRTLREELAAGALSTRKRRITRSRWPRAWRPPMAEESFTAQRAVILAPNLADAHLSLALALAGDYDWPGVEREIKHALELDPNLALAHDQYAWMLSVNGRSDEAAAQSKLAVEQDPFSPLMHLNRGYWFYLARRFDEANIHIRKALELDPNSPWALRMLGWSLLWKGDKAGALPLMEKAQSLDADPFSIGSFGYALAVSGDRAKAEQILRALENLAKQRYVSPAASMVVHIGLGEKEKGLS